MKKINIVLLSFLMMSFSIYSASSIYSSGPTKIMPNYETESGIEQANSMIQQLQDRFKKTNKPDLIDLIIMGEDFCLFPCLSDKVYAEFINIINPKIKNIPEMKDMTEDDVLTVEKLLKIPGSEKTPAYNLLRKIMYELKSNNSKNVLRSKLLLNIHTALGRSREYARELMENSLQ